MQPVWPDIVCAESGDHAACRAAIRAGSRSFYTASIVLPAEVRQPALALYAFCRSADDVADSGASPDRLALLRVRLARAYAGNPLGLSADRAFADVVQMFAIPRELPEALLEGFEWDLAGRRYRDAAELCDYASRVAGTVGAMFACLMNARTPELMARACDLGIAMQLTNIARDVGEDARAGRLYLPTDWLLAADIDPQAWLVEPTFDARLGSVIQRILQLASDFYRRADAGIDALPLRLRPGVRAAAAIYEEIGTRLARSGCDSISVRAVVPSRIRLWLLGRSVCRAAFAPRVDADKLNVPAHASARFLVDAASRASSLGYGPHTGGQRIAWVFELFARLELREARRQSGSRP